MLNNSKEEQARSEEQKKVYAALKRELEYFRIYFPSQSDYSAQVTTEWYEKAKTENSPDFSDWRFNQPQYNYQILNYAINLSDSKIIDIELYTRLQSIYSNLRRLEHAEIQLTELAGRYRAVHPKLKKTDTEYLNRVADNRLLLSRFLIFSRDRTNNLANTAAAASEALTIINERMGPAYLREVELKLIKDGLKDEDNPEQMIPMILKAFPSYTEDEIKELL